MLTCGLACVAWLAIVRLPASAQTISNGGFESGSVGWSATAIGSGHPTSAGIVALDHPHSGSRYAYLGDYPAGQFNALGSVHQTNVAIPANATSVTLSFYLNVTTNETTNSTQYDLLDVNLRRSVDDSLRAKLRTFSNLNKATGNTPGLYTQQLIDLTPYRGETVTLQFYVDTNGSAGTIFRIDDVSLTVSGCSPSCAGKCGGASDGCGGTCTAGCGTYQVCSNQSCVTITPHLTIPTAVNVGQSATLLCNLGSAGAGQTVAFFADNDGAPPYLAQGQQIADGSGVARWTQTVQSTWAPGVSVLCRADTVLGQPTSGWLNVSVNQCSCTGKCGGAPDGCGGSCTGSCGTNQVCSGQACVTITPQLTVPQAVNVGQTTAAFTCNLGNAGAFASVAFIVTQGGSIIDSHATTADLTGVAGWSPTVPSRWAPSVSMQCRADSVVGQPTSAWRTLPVNQCSCTGKCGGAPDGCGGTCTASCGSGQVCSNQSCVSITPRLTIPSAAGVGQSATFTCGLGSAGAGATVAFLVSNGTIIATQGKTADATGTATWATTIPAGWAPSVSIICRADSVAGQPTSGWQPLSVPQCSCSGKCGGASDGCGGACTASCGNYQVCSNQSCVTITPRLTIPAAVSVGQTTTFTCDLGTAGAGQTIAFFVNQGNNPLTSSQQIADANGRASWSPSVGSTWAPSVAVLCRADTVTGTPTSGWQSLSVSSSPLSDLVIQSLSVSPLSGTAGSPATVSFTIRNQGNRAADPSVANIQLVM